MQDGITELAAIDATFEDHVMNGKRDLTRIHGMAPFCSISVYGFTTNDNNNGFKVRFGVRGRHRDPLFTLGSHQFIIIVAIQDEGENVYSMFW